jgi:hypothetical protein
MLCVAQSGQVCHDLDMRNTPAATTLHLQVQRAALVLELIQLIQPREIRPENLLGPLPVVSTAAQTDEVYSCCDD